MSLKMSRKFISSLVAAAMAFTSISAVPAAAGDRNRNLERFFIGAGTILLLNQLAEQNFHAHYDKKRHPKQNKWKKKRHYAPLPGYCLTRVETRNGPVRMFGQRCLNRNYHQAHRLPRACKIEVKTRNRGHRVTRRGYDPRCLRNRGFRVARR